MIETKMYTASQVAKLLSVDPETVRRWHRENKIKTVQVGAGRIRIPENEVKRLLGE